MFKGSNVALITPFKNNKLDIDAYIKLIHLHLKNGTNGLVPAGTTGESPTLSHTEHKKIIEISVKECKGKIPVISGTGSNSTKEAIELSQFAEKVPALVLRLQISTLQVCSMAMIAVSRKLTKVMTMRVNQRAVEETLRSNCGWALCWYVVNLLLMCPTMLKDYPILRQYNKDRLQ